MTAKGLDDNTTDTSTVLLVVCLGNKRLLKVMGKMWVLNASKHIWKSMSPCTCSCRRNGIGLPEINKLTFGPTSNTVYDRKGECVVLSGEKPCSYKIAGKKTTNLKRHFKTPGVTVWPDQIPLCPPAGGFISNLHSAENCHQPLPWPRVWSWMRPGWTYCWTSNVFSNTSRGTQLNFSAELLYFFNVK